MRSRIVIPAAILVTAAYVKGRLDAQLAADAGDPAPIPVVTPGDPVRRAEAEAADALAVAEAQTAAAAVPVAEPARPRFTPHAFRPQVFTPRPPSAAAPAFEVPALEWPSFEPAWLAGPPRPPRTPDPVERAVLAEWLVTPAPAISRPERDPAAAAALCEWTAPVADPPAAVAAAAAESVAEPEPALVIDEAGRFSLGGWAAQAGHMALVGVTFRDRRGLPVEASAIRLVPEATANVADGGLVVLADPGFAPDSEGFTLLLAAAGPGSFAASGRYEVVATA